MLPSGSFTPSAPMADNRKILSELLSTIYIHVWWTFFTNPLKPRCYSNSTWGYNKVGKWRRIYATPGSFVCYIIWISDENAIAIALAYSMYKCIVGKVYHLRMSWPYIFQTFFTVKGTIQSVVGEIL